MVLAGYGAVGQSGEELPRINSPEDIQNCFKTLTKVSPKPQAGRNLEAAHLVGHPPPLFLVEAPGDLPTTDG